MTTQSGAAANNNSNAFENEQKWSVGDGTSTQPATINLDIVAQKLPSLLPYVKRFDTNNTGEILLSELAEGQKELLSHLRYVFWLKRIVMWLFLVFLIQTGITVGVILWAIELTKEIGAVESGGSSYFTSKTNPKSILQTKDAESIVALEHAPVLDAAHLVSIQALTYQYQLGGLEGTKVLAGSKVVKFEKTFTTNLTFDDESAVVDAPEVTFFLATGAKVIVNPWHSRLIENEGVFTLCGALSCSKLEVDDPAVDAGKLEDMIRDLQQKHPHVPRRQEECRRLLFDQSRNREAVYR